MGCFVILCSSELYRIKEPHETAWILISLEPHGIEMHGAAKSVEPLEFRCMESHKVWNHWNLNFIESHRVWNHMELRSM